MEVEENGSLPFLVVLTMKKPNGSLAHKVFRTKTHTEQHLHANSHHHPTQKLGILKTLITRALRISNDEHLEKEKLHILKVFKEFLLKGNNFGSARVWSNCELGFGSHDHSRGQHEHQRRG
jgi:hypothetical protein